jgi:ribosomal protein S18 acetylase RimI-like enzyme
LLTRCSARFSNCLYSEGVHYRLYRPEDFAALYAIEESCYAPPQRFGRASMRQLIHGGRTATWIAEEDGKMAGFAIVEWSRDTAGIVGYIQTLEVAPARRGHGIGAELLRRAEGSARKLGARILWLHVHEDNPAAIRLYQAHGYRRTGKLENYYARGQAALVCVKRLENEEEAGGAQC